MFDHRILNMSLIFSTPSVNETTMQTSSNTNFCSFRGGAGFTVGHMCPTELVRKATQVFKVNYGFFLPPVTQLLVTLYDFLKHLAWKRLLQSIVFKKNARIKVKTKQNAERSSIFLFIRLNDFLRISFKVLWPTYGLLPNVSYLVRLLPVWLL